MTAISPVHAPDSPAMDALCAELANRAAEVDRSAAWPREQLQWLAEAGVYRWFMPAAWGGFDWSETDLIRGYMRLASACLTTTFILTQRSAAVRRIIESENESAKEALLPALAEGTQFTTVGISHLTTSRRHLAKPVLAARETKAGFVLDGYSPWVTGAPHAETVVVGATLDDGRQILLAMPMSLAGISIPPHAELLGLTASHTGPIEFKQVEIDRSWLLDGPMENVIAARSGAKTGRLQTSALATGLSAAAIEFLETETTKRANLANPTAGLRAEHTTLESDLLALAGGQAACSSDDVRARANSLALRSAQAALAAAKGTGYVSGHPAGRWCREALFFLVWSCPQPVMAANLCELAGLSE
ncbi:MAG TPA: acyl-CoA dehydrogenase family protein [Pirellulales bacterium]|jgi:alkylation response protein AidB-like acyl-CoA dehydrogenase